MPENPYKSPEAEGHWPVLNWAAVVFWCLFSLIPIAGVCRLWLDHRPELTPTKTWTVNVFVGSDNAQK